MAVKGRVIQGKDKPGNYRVLVEPGRRVVVLGENKALRMERGALPLDQTIYVDHVVMGDYVFFARQDGWWKPEDRPSIPLHSRNAFAILYPRTLWSDTDVGSTVEALRAHKDYGLVSVIAGFENKTQAETAMNSGVYGALLIKNSDLKVEPFELDSRIRELGSSFYSDIHMAAHYILMAADQGISSLIVSAEESPLNQLKSLMQHKGLPGKLWVVPPFEEELVVSEIIRILKERAEKISQESHATAHRGPTHNRRQGPQITSLSSDEFTPRKPGPHHRIGDY